MSTSSENPLRAEFLRARTETDNLFRLIGPETLYERPIPERHRLIFYLGHLEAFDWNLLGARALNLPRFHAEFDDLFAFGIDPPEGSAEGDKPSDWPSEDEVRNYNRRVRETLDSALDKVPEQYLHVALEHRWMHAETFAYLLHNLPVETKIRQPEKAPLPAQTLDKRMVDIPAGSATLGLADGDGFGWDNEFKQHKADVPAFSISRYKVTNGEYLEFVKDGGEPSHFWVRHGGGWYWRGMFEEFPLPLEWPVYVTHAQAQAYAAWAGKQLPSEEQFHRAAYGTPTGDERAYPWGNSQPDTVSGNFDFERWDPVSVAATPETDSAFGVSQLVGNSWEWTSTVFEPFDGFKPFAFYPRYSANFFDGQHYVIKGGSPRTAAPLLRRSFRNWFRPNYPYLYAGFRLVEN
ncbi:MAG: SUMF1/EgtB/PvdO family nonheme iron enzyme [Bryobacterales bacterium]|nr:SUMF1/EgtB/PvdO family nonheme iron enzyme [Bryobacterales bacterium]